MNHFNVGDIVIYTSRRYGDNPSNPLWNGTQGQVCGYISEIEYESIHYVLWENGEHNAYYERDITLLSNIQTLPKDLFEL